MKDNNKQRRLLALTSILAALPLSLSTMSASAETLEERVARLEAALADTQTQKEEK